MNYCCRKLAFVMSVNLHPDQMSGEKPDYRDSFNQTQLLTEVSLLLRFLKIGSFRHLEGRFLKKYCLALNRSVAPKKVDDCCFTRQIRLLNPNQM